MRLLIDGNPPRFLVKQLADSGFDVQHVRGIGLQGTPNAEVMEAALAADAMIVTRGRE